MSWPGLRTLRSKASMQYRPSIGQHGSKRQYWFPSLTHPCHPHSTLIAMLRTPPPAPYEYLYAGVRATARPYCSGPRAQKYNG